MPANTSVTGALVAQPVAPDRECVINGTQIIQLVQDFMQVLISQGAQQGGDGNSVADQALNVANTALALAQSVQNSLPQRRGLQGDPLPLEAGPNSVPLTWTPPMPDTNYEVRVTFYGPNSGSANFSWWVIDSTRTVNGCNLRLVNIPSGFSMGWVVEDLSV